MSPGIMSLYDRLKAMRGPIRNARLYANQPACAVQTRRRSCMRNSARGMLLCSRIIHFSFPDPGEPHVLGCNKGIAPCLVR